MTKKIDVLLMSLRWPNFEDSFRAYRQQALNYGLQKGKLLIFVSFNYKYSQDVKLTVLGRLLNF